MDELLLARHGESETAAAGVVGGDAAFTARGREQARALAGRAFDVCFTSPALASRSFLRGRVRADPLAVLGEPAPVEGAEPDVAELAEDLDRHVAPRQRELGGLARA